NSQKGVDNIIAPVGLSWYKAMYPNSQIYLYSGDDRHPSRAGTYLYAAVMYTIIFKSNPEIANDHIFQDMKTETRHFLCKTAFNTVYDTLSYTNLSSHSIQIYIYRKILF